MRDRQQKSEREVEGTAEIESFDQLPQPYDYRMETILSEPSPESTIVSFFYVAFRDPRPNYRWELHQDGQLFFVRHSGQNISDVPFDRPLPLQPTKVLSSAEIQALYSQLEQADFFEQPKYQRRPRVEGGGYVLVRARRGDTFHEVVYENVEGPLVQYLYSLAD